MKALPKPTRPMTITEPNYRELLKRYMRHVVAIEGTTLLGKETFEDVLSERDLDELQKLDYENA